MLFRASIDQPFRYESTVIISAELRQLPVTEKLKLIEALWDDLLDNENDVPTLSWHKEELQRTEAAYAAGDV